ncbi:hypothetical protein PR048_029291 [Dryococelus australis]|uniref:Uncharacterized protein n=1 Tax=Dryococelus australis TaxID=614101 RepID=A0ABQ9GCX7_9NEOP|nr:hypothetical protein PR048_029291 [Dryococelus australis]
MEIEKLRNGEDATGSTVIPSLKLTKGSRKGTCHVSIAEVDILRCFRALAANLGTSRPRCTFLGHEALGSARKSLQRYFAVCSSSQGSKSHGDRKEGQSSIARITENTCFKLQAILIVRFVLNKHSSKVIRHGISLWMQLILSMNPQMDALVRETWCWGGGGNLPGIKNSTTSFTCKNPYSDTPSVEPISSYCLRDTFHGAAVTLTGFDSRRGHSRTFACGNHAGRCRWLVGFLGNLPFPPPLHSDSATYSPNFTLIGSQDLDVKSQPNLPTFEILQPPNNCTRHQHKIIFLLLLLHDCSCVPRNINQSYGARRVKINQEYYTKALEQRHGRSLVSFLVIRKSTLRASPYFVGLSQQRENKNPTGQICYLQGVYVAAESYSIIKNGSFCTKTLFLEGRCGQTEGRGGNSTPLTDPPSFLFETLPSAQSPPSPTLRELERQGGRTFTIVATASRDVRASADSREQALAEVPRRHCTINRPTNSYGYLLHLWWLSPQFPRVGPLGWMEGVRRTSGLLRETSDVEGKRPSCLPHRFVTPISSSSPLGASASERLAAPPDSRRGGAAVAERLDRSPPTKATVLGRGDRAGRCRWSAGFLVDLPFSPPFHSGAAPHPPHFTLIGSQDLDVKSHPNLFAHAPYRGGTFVPLDAAPNSRTFPRTRILFARQNNPTEVIEVNVEPRRNEGAGEAGDPREDPPTNGIVRHDSHLRKSGVTRPGIEPGSHWWEASRLTAQPPWPLCGNSNPALLVFHRVDSTCHSQFVPCSTFFPPSVFDMTSTLGSGINYVLKGAITPKTAYLPGTAVTERLACSPPTKVNRVRSPAGSLPDFRMLEPCRTMPLVGGFSRGSPVSPAPSLRCCSILTSRPTSIIINVMSTYFASKRFGTLYNHGGYVILFLLEHNQSTMLGSQNRALGNPYFNCAPGGLLLSADNSLITCTYYARYCLKWEPYSGDACYNFMGKLLCAGGNSDDLPNKGRGESGGPPP